MSGHGRGRGRSRGLEEEHVEHVDERWMASYMDMVTVLMCMFIVLFAMSSVDQSKFVQLKNSLATGFGATDVGKVDTAKGVVVTKDKVKQGEATGFTNLDLAVAEVKNLSSAQKAIQDAVDAKGIGSMVQFVIDSRGLTVGLVGSEAYFAPNLADLSPQALQVLDTIAPILASQPNEVKIEGHADRHGITVNYPTDWELSSARATAVLRRLVEFGGIAQERISSVGYGSARSVATGSDLAAMAQNRRVDVVMLSSQPEAVRALIPSVLDGTAVIPAPAASAEPPAAPAASADSTTTTTRTPTSTTTTTTGKTTTKTGH